MQPIDEHRAKLLAESNWDSWEIDWSHSEPVTEDNSTNPVCWYVTTHFTDGSRGGVIVREDGTTEIDYEINSEGETV